MNTTSVWKTVLRMLAILVAVSDAHLHPIPRWLRHRAGLMQGPVARRWAPGRRIPQYSIRVQAPGSRGTVLRHTLVLPGNSNLVNSPNHHIEISLSTGRDNPVIPRNTNRPINNWRRMDVASRQNGRVRKGNGNAINNNNNNNNNINNNNIMSERSISGFNAELPFGLSDRRNIPSNSDRGLSLSKNILNNRRVQPASSIGENLAYSVKPGNNQNIDYSPLFELLSDLQVGRSIRNSNRVMTRDILADTRDIPRVTSGNVMDGRSKPGNSVGPSRIRNLSTPQGMTAEEIIEAFEA